MLTPSQISLYHSQGYLAVENVLTPGEIQELRRVTEEFIEKSREVTEHTEVFDLEPGHTREQPRLRRLKHPVGQHPVYDRTMRHPKILDIVEDLTGHHGVRTNGDKLNIKWAGYGSAVEWHQDWSYYPHTNDDLLAVGVAMDDMDLENGCLMVIPGTHRQKIWDHHQRGVFVGAVTEPDFDPSNAVPVQVKAGGISLHHARLLHGSAPNRSSRPRRLLLFQYCAVDAWPLGGVKDWNEFNALILRGQPTHLPRMTSCPIRIPLPYAEKGGSIYEVQSLLDNKLFAKQAK